MKTHHHFGVSTQSPRGVCFSFLEKYTPLGDGVDNFLELYVVTEIICIVYSIYTPIMACYHPRETYEQQIRIQRGEVTLGM